MSVADFINLYKYLLKLERASCSGLWCRHCHSPGDCGSPCASVGFGFYAAAPRITFELSTLTLTSPHLQPSPDRTNAAKFTTEVKAKIQPSPRPQTTPLEPVTQRKTSRQVEVLHLHPAAATRGPTNPSNRPSAAPFRTLP